MKIGNMQKAGKQKGFTLIEIAIVLVIIGLLLGGVLQGQQLIENSRVKAAVNYINGISAGAFSYSDRYGRLPGDDPGAITTRGSSWKNSAGGDGDGVITDAMDVFDPTATSETVIFFQDLRSAGFMTGDPSLNDKTALPANPFGGLITVVTSAKLGDASTPPNMLNGTKVCMGNVPGTGAIALDTQLDDGKPNSGRFRASLSATPNLAPDDAAATAYSEDSSYTACYRI